MRPQTIPGFDDNDRQRRMLDNGQHHRRPPLAVVVWEFNREGRIKKQYEGLKPKQVVRLRQAVSVVVRLVMVKDD